MIPNLPMSYQVAVEAALKNKTLMQAAAFLAENRLSEAEPLIKLHLKQNPFDVAAIRMLAELAARIGRFKDSETLLRRALELSPDFGAARANLATVLYRQNRSNEAIAELDHLINIDPENIAHTNLKAASLGKIGEFEEAISLYEKVLEQAPKQPRLWMSYGHMLKTVGRTQDGIVAYRQALEITPHLGEVWWSLANLKTVRFSKDDVQKMQEALSLQTISDEDLLHLHFALGKALEDQKSYEASFAHYETGNKIRRSSLTYKADETTSFVDESITQFTQQFFKDRETVGCEAADPIFILGMPRAGSTLIEQILSSHSLVEGTSELPDIPALARRWSNYPKRLLDQEFESFKKLGEEYLKRTQIQRKSKKPFFIDKLPNNWAHVPLIHLILPHAKIIDARRHPLGCCFSNFKQHFARGQAFTYSLEDMGRYYLDYVRLMDHIDQTLPHRVHRIFYENMVENTEHEIRRLLDFCGLEFEEQCLRFHETDRAVRTASSEQVRRPIFNEGKEGWRGFDPWLLPLKGALKEALTTYPYDNEPNMLPFHHGQ